ncbi:integrator complex subunit 4 homolog [Lucilia sericata]|uniref:integrator complex subunit 4 homolog n=1 Tax=Lucilia sericata TaxID=13632 RepID=UPI0018A83A6A|nr:integrator complex subunit 4 homolog [Lucilia sericata]
MLDLITLIILILALYHTCYGLYPTYNYVQQQQQLLQHDLLQQQQQLLQQQQQLLQQKQQQGQGQPNRVTNLNIVLPKTIVEDFEYIPTIQGYRYSYQLPDGSRREENAFITGLRMDDYSRLDSRTTDFTAVGVGGRPKKNRKLSPGSLKSLSG